MTTADCSWTLEFKDLKKQIQKSLILVEQCIKIWKGVEKDSKTHVQRVSNLTEQYQCSSKVSNNSLSVMRHCPDVKGKLLYKIGIEIRDEILQLKEQLSNLKDCSFSLTKQFEKCMECYRRSCRPDDLSDLLKKTPMYPSVAEMLEWLQICERFVREGYLCKQYILDTYCPDHSEETDVFEKSWTADDAQQIAKLEDYMAYTANFTMLKLT